MKQQFKLNINNPCGEKFEDFSPTQAGGFCQSCQKEVIDFTKMSDKELIDYFKDAPPNTCGRFAPTQLTTYTTPSSASRKQGFNWLGAGLFSLSIFSILPIGNLQAKENAHTKSPSTHQSLTSANSATIQGRPKLSRPPNTVRGKVVDKEDGSPLPGVNVVIKGTMIGTVTDREGEFSINVPQGATLIFSYIGYGIQELEIKKKSVTASSEITLMELREAVTGAVHVEKPHKAKRSLWQKFKSLFK